MPLDYQKSAICVCTLPFVIFIRLRLIIFDERFFMLVRVCVKWFGGI